MEYSSCCSSNKHLLQKLNGTWRVCDKENAGPPVQPQHLPLALIHFAADAVICLVIAFAKITDTWRARVTSVFRVPRLPAPRRRAQHRSATRTDLHCRHQHPCFPASLLSQFRVFPDDNLWFQMMVMIFSASHSGSTLFLVKWLNILLTESWLKHFLD